MRGFILFEYMIAFVCSALLIFMVASVLSEFYVRVARYSSSCITTIEMARAWFLLERDLVYAPVDHSLWKKRSPSDFIYASSAGDCGWLIMKDRLVRTLGFYDPTRGVWHQSHDSVALIGVNKFMLSWIMDSQNVVGCEVFLESRDQRFRYVVAFANDRVIKIDPQAMT